MDIDPDLVAFDRELASFAARPAVSDDWMSAANLASARTLRGLVHEAWMPGRRGVVARFHEGLVTGHIAPAYQVLRTAYEFNDAVVAVANWMRGRPYTTINDAVRERFGLLIRPVMAGSVEIDLVCPLAGIDEAMELPPTESPGQGVIPASLTSGSEVALDRVLSVLRSATETRKRLERSSTADTIGPDGWRKIARLAGRCVEADFIVDFWPRTEPRRVFSFTPAHAAALKTFIKERSLTASEVAYTGMWLTASSVRTVFDLQTDVNRRISGQVPPELLELSVSLLNQRVRAVVREESDPETEDQVVSRTLVSLEPSPLGQENLYREPPSQEW